MGDELGLRQDEARLAWIEAIRVVYASALDLLGVAAPERMDRPKDETLATETVDDDAVARLEHGRCT